MNLFILIHAPEQNSPPSFYYRELRIPPEQRFLKTFFPEEKGEEDYGVEKIPKLTKVSVTSFDKFHHLCNLYIFGLRFVVQ